MDNIYVASGAAAIVTSTLMQIVKNSQMFPWISRDTGKLNAIVSIIAAGLATFGISYTFNFDAETGQFAMGFAGSISDVISGIGRWIAQWCGQQTVYKGFLAPAEILGEMRADFQKAIMNQAPKDKPEDPPTPAPPTVNV